MNATSIIFQPDLPIWLIAALAGLSAVLVLFALWRGLPGWWLRAFAALVLITALSNPQLKEEERDGLNDIVFLVTDRTASQTIAPRPDQVAAALDELRGTLGGPGTALDIIEVTVEDGKGLDADRGTLLATALAKAAAEHAADRIAGALILSDGRIEDADILPDFPAPVHLLLTGTDDEWDRRLLIETAPAFGIINEPLSLSLKVEEIGPTPTPLAIIPVAISVDGGAPQVFQVRTGETATIEMELDHGGVNVLQLSIPSQDGELTDRNNTAIVSINGVRDRLRVLLVSGEPHAGERTWRNLLKSDAAVDLVHFTILRPPHKQDGVPVYELSLIAFPTRELFMDKIEEFDLIIFDRYRRRGVLPALYMENIVRYVKEGGALLVASGPSYASAESLYRTPLAEILPTAPTAEVIEEGYVPMISELGARHPVTERLDDLAPRPTEDGIPGWGRWFRLVDTVVTSGQVVMEGPLQRPLLVVDRPGEGRIAALSSDHAWLWSRGYEGGGPQLELLRRLAHWLMKEPELEEEVLIAAADGQDVVVTRRTMADAVGGLKVVAPDGTETALPFIETAPGRFEAQFSAEENGLYRLSEGTLTGVVAVGPAAPKEYENPLSTGAILKPLTDTTRGGILRLADGVPDIRFVSEGRVGAGRGWVGLAERNAYSVTDIRLSPLAPGWLMLLLAASFAILAWRVESR